MINTIIIDAEMPERERMSAALSGRDGIMVAASGKDGYAAMTLAGKLKPNIIILNYRLYSVDEGIPALIRARSPSTRIIVMAEKITDDRLCRAFVKKIPGIVDKNTDMERLPDILKYVHEGKYFISPCFAERVLNFLIYDKGAGFRLSANMIPDGAVPSFSKTEIHLFENVVKGYNGKEIAENMNLSDGTVRNYISRLLRKTGLSSRSQMVGYAIFHGLVPLDTSPAAPKTARR